MKKTSKKIIKAIATVLAVAIALAMILTLPACNESEEPEKKGMIFCTALLSGSLMQADDGTPLWDPLTEPVMSIDAIVNENGAFEIKFDKLGNAISNLLKNKELFAYIFDKEHSALDDLTLDADGNSIGDLVPCTMDSEYCQKYGVFACYEDIYNDLYATYGEEYEVSIFNYDWRLDVRKNSQLLQEFIQENEYDKVVLIAHSMGGNVVANYLANSEANRSKVEAFISFGSPYYGSAMALDLFENIGDFVNYADDIENSSFGVFLSGMDLASLIEDKVVPMARSWTSLYQLMPFPELLCDANDGNGSFCLEVDGKVITTADELYAFYESRPWAKDENGNLLKAVKELREYHESFYVDVDGEKVFSTKLVNTYYVAGDLCGTLSNMVYIDGELDDRNTSKTGDGTVLINSAGKQFGSEWFTANEKVAHIPLGLYTKYTTEPIATAIANKPIEEEPKTIWQKLFDK